jgi:quercetin dioxygenase-like cupin family protein
MEIKRFGPGHRRPDGPPGTQGVAGQLIYNDDRAYITELAFQRYAIITPHANPTNTSIFIVISGGGFVQVGDERTRINHGEAVVWPPESIHGAYTDGTEMRAIVVELIGGREGDTEHEPGGRMASLAGSAQEISREPVTPAEGTLADRKVSREEYDSHEGEPW